MHVMIAAGGTGGHLYPGIAMAQAFRDRDAGCQITFIGTEHGIETKVIPGEGYDLRLIRVHGWVGVNLIKKILALAELPFALIQSVRLLRQINPDLVIGIGGYASGPVVLSAWLLGYHRVLIEPNVLPGLTNRILAPFVERIFLAYEEAQNHLSGSGKIRIFGNPVRKEMHAPTSIQETTVSQRTLLVVGGSQGAHSINRAMIDALDPLDTLRDRLRIIHQTGERDYAWVRQAYDEKGYSAVVTPYLGRISEVYTSTDLVVSRSGATTIAELTACGLPAILIPYRYATRGHQEANARALERAGAAYIIKDEELNGALLASRVYGLLRDPMGLHEMARNSRSLGRPHAAERIAGECMQLMGREQI